MIAEMWLIDLSLAVLLFWLLELALGGTDAR